MENYQGIHINTGLKVKGYGERREEHPKNFSNICFKYHIC